MIPKEVIYIGETLINKGFEAYLVGGCVRDLLRGETPKDWDITTNAAPEEIQKLFPESVYENNFGTVGVKTDSDDSRLKIVEVTTFRIEGKYTDKRHPDEVKFAKTVEEDLARRDFTVNAMAMKLTNNERQTTDDAALVDPFHGREDLKKKLIRAVGEPVRRFEEDALRMLRAVRFSVELGFEIEKMTYEAIHASAGLLEMIAKERIRDEFEKMIMSSRSAEALILLEELNLLKFVLPEIRESIGVGQNKHHIFTVFEHSLKALSYATEKGYSLEIRLAALLHDVGKPKTKRGEGANSTFYGHEVVGAKMTARALDRLHFSKELIERVTHLVRYHMFYYNVGEVSAAGVRRFLRRVGPENVEALIQLREADRIGSGVPKAVPYKLRHFLFMMEKVKHDPIHPKMLKISGTDIMKLLHIEPGPRIGYILHTLLEGVLDDPKNNNKKYLEKKVKELGELTDKELEKCAQQAKEKEEKEEGEIEEKIKRKHRVS